MAVHRISNRTHRLPNFVRNPRSTGAVPGAPGTLPANWTSFFQSTGIAPSVIGSGIENSLWYADIRWLGTQTAGALANFIFIEPGGSIACLPGQTWLSSVNLRLVGGSLANIQFSTALEWDTSGFAFINSWAVNCAPTAANLASQRFTISNPAPLEATSAVLKISIIGTVTAAAAVDATIRIGMPQAFHK